MSIPGPPDPAKLVVGMFTGETDIIETVAEKLVQRFGDIDLVSRWLAFDFTDYYTEELGRPLYRRVFSFQHLIEQQTLPAVKNATNAIERELTQDGKRRVNIDPGYMLRERFVLATGKNYSHRIYIGDGIYADLTLIYQNRAFQTLPWTYPDYADDNMQAFLQRVRDRYLVGLKAMKPERQEKG
ncbi:MAG: DUF4416 family protein [Thermodesulfobacteriota bacterium]|nr:DUF4416 family protein [Thermodesulfobacteriota bacterium]